ncbi:CCA tRNA nucleotidyltransferase [Bacillus sp. DJP31]|uniref:CCA tRNA nucleotidyltransferase n=1 Tax=Bacillus sp. DJP31 TaxID=3409789 RepID=UPI003BB80B0A
MDPIFTKPMEIINTLQIQGYQAFFVGGAVRDSLLGRKIGDVDIATSATPIEVIAHFPKTIPVGIQHGTIIVMLDGVGYEVTTFRKDEEYLDHRRPTSVTFIDSLSEDLKRRDFTMNAIAMDCDGHLFDPFGGQEAIKMKIIQTVGTPADRFKEDALRMLRAIRFHSQFSFTIEQKTKEAIRLQAHLLKHVSIERITTEFEKILSGPSCHSALKVVGECGLGASIENLATYEETLQEWENIDYTALQSNSERWSLFSYLLKVKDVESFLMSWKLPRKTIRDAVKIVAGLKTVIESGWTPLILYKTGRNISTSIERIYSVIHKLNVEVRVKERVNEYENLPINDKVAIDFETLDLFEVWERKPGPWINEALDSIVMALLNGQVQNDRESIREWLVSCSQ